MAVEEEEEEEEDGRRRRYASRAWPDPGGRAKTSLAVARTVRVPLGEDDTSVLIRVREADGSGCILHGLREAGVRNPAEIYPAVERSARSSATA